MGSISPLAPPRPTLRSPPATWSFAVSGSWHIGRAGRAAQPVRGAAHPVAAPVEHMRVHKSRLHVAVAERLLHGADVITIEQQVSHEGRLERVAGGPLTDPRRHHGLMHVPLDQRFVDVVPEEATGLTIAVAARRR